MNILILNWRDPKNPRSGGAEKITFKYAEYWASQGHKVTWICNTYTGAKDFEVQSGINFIRLGPGLGFTVNELIVTYPVFLAKTIIRAMQILMEERVDLVIDEIHGLPFFTPLFVRSRKVFLVCEVAGTIWDKMFPFPINFGGRMLEALVFLLYRNTETWAISENTKRDVKKLNKNAKIKVLPLGIDEQSAPKVKKFSYPSAVFLGRLVKMKGVESALIATSDVVKKLPKFHLSIVGTAEAQYLLYLKSLVVKLGIEKNVTFVGFVSESRKFEILAKSHFLLHSSYKEGFGLTVLEAGLMKTPTIARSGSSLDELISHKRSGILFDEDREIGDYLLKYFRSKNSYKFMSESARSRSVKFLWNNILKSSNEVTRI